MRGVDLPGGSCGEGGQGKSGCQSGGDCDTREKLAHGCCLLDLALRQSRFYSAAFTPVRERGLPPTARRESLSVQRAGGGTDACEAREQADRDFSKERDPRGRCGF